MGTCWASTSRLEARSLKRGLDSRSSNPSVTVLVEGNRQPDALRPASEAAGSKGAQSFFMRRRTHVHLCMLRTHLHSTCIAKLWQLPQGGGKWVRKRRAINLRETMAQCAYSALPRVDTVEKVRAKADMRASIHRVDHDTHIHVYFHGKYT
jgi:hypothetical protein